MNAHEIDYKIIGDDMQCVEIELDPQETIVAEAGSLMMKDSEIVMQTIFGDGSGQETGFFGKVLSAGKRLLTGESLFLTAYTHMGHGKKQVTFAAPYPGKVVAFDLSQYQGKVVCQKDAFLCAAKGVAVGIEFQKKIGTGLFGGEGFIMQKLEGDGLAFIHAGGTIIEKTLLPDEKLHVDTGCLVALTRDVNYDIEFVGGIKNTLFGGEGVFFASLSGPGKVWIQSLPFSRLAGRIVASAPQLGGSRKGEGSILGGLGGLIDGDNS
ncbi:MAG: TIGR00266 family protein [Flavobacteriales bacterium]|nr:TIGR00266 family protein [Flavobacteriales bacterium]MBX2960359.1 TIGR00266 family protein [Flavobacteriales bacterium]